MLLIWIAALFGVFRFRTLSYWRWVGIVFIWMIAANLLFYADGTLQNPEGDGVITRMIRLSTNDGPGMAVFALVLVAVYYGGIIIMLRKAWSAGKEYDQDRLEAEYEVTDIPLARKATEAVVVTAVIAAYIYFTMVPSARERQVSHAQSEPASVEGSELVGGTGHASLPSQPSNIDPVEMQLAAAARDLNRTLPQKVDQITTLEGATVQGRVFTYHYRLSRRDAPDSGLRKFIRESVVPRACRDSRMRAAIKDYSIVYRYEYTLPNADNKVSGDADWAACKNIS